MKWFVFSSEVLPVVSPKTLYYKLQNKFHVSVRFGNISRREVSVFMLLDFFHHSTYSLIAEESVCVGGWFNKCTSGDVMVGDGG